MSTFARHFVAALVGQPIFEADEQPERRPKAMVLWSGLPVETEKQKAAELLAAVVHAYHEVYGTWPAPPRVRAALDALGVPTFPQDDDVSPDT